jgi:hypothetical protein
MQLDTAAQWEYLSRSPRTGGRHRVDGLATHYPIYEEMVFKFVEHFYYIAAGINRSGSDGMWDDEDGFYYDLLRLPNGGAMRLKVRWSGSSRYALPRRSSRRSGSAFRRP